MTTKEELLYTTVRLTILKTNHTSADNDMKFATGFLISKDVMGLAKGVIVVNKHSLFFDEEYTEENFCTQIKLTMCEMVDNNPIDTSHLDYDASDIYNKVIFHPSSNVDLCIIPCECFKTKNRNKKPFMIWYPASRIDLQQCSIENLDAIENVITIGYPNAFWDYKNNKPIVRSGITATHPGLDFEGKKEFYLDIAVHEGSSGSPVFLYSSIQHPKTGGIVIGTPTLIFLGIIDAQRPIKVNNKSNTDSFEISMNLAKVIKVERILELLDIYESKIKEELP